MTAPRGKVEASLAERGRPAMWANEQEAAALCGLGWQQYRKLLPTLESRGFPQVNPLNGQRPIPAILAFWKLQINDIGTFAAALEPVTDDDREEWNGTPSQRIAS